jgi:polygalacturonase/pectin methylesterase-like acyl-CoA thioesterase
MTHRISCRLLIFTMICVAASLRAQNLINVKPYIGSLSGVTGPAVIGTPGDAWNAFGNLPNTGGTLTNAATIIDSSGATVSGVTMTLSINGASLSGFNSSAFGANPTTIMSSYIYDGNGDYFTVVFSGLPANKAYMLYGMSTGNADQQGSTWWVDTANGHGTATATANFTSGSPLGTRDATQATNQGICWVKIPATTTATGVLTFRLCKLGATESGGVVSGGSGRAYFNAFQLQPLSAPVISNLTNQTAIAGTTAILNPAISGVPAPSYQWRSNSVVIAGATNSSLTFNNVQYVQNGTVYSLVASNYVGVVTNSMTLTVIVTPSITGLNNQAAPVGATVTISPTVSGAPTPATRWRLGGNNLSDGATGNGSTISGSATSTLVINNAQAADSGAYSLIATNVAGMVTNSMTLTVSSGNVAPSISGPMDQTVVQSNNATFTASVSGLPVPTLQWRVNGAAISGQTNSSLIVTNVQYSQNGFVYSLIASNVAGLATNSANLFVLVPPVISQQPTNLSVVVGASATFSVTASGVPAVKYQWNRNGSPIFNATNATYTLSSPQGADSGAIFSVVVSNNVGVATSSNAMLTVLSTTLTATLLPANGAVNISPDQQLRIVFFGGSPILNTNGVLTVRDAANNSVVAAIDSSQFLSYTPGNTSIQTIPNAAIRSVQGASYYYMPIALYGNEAWITLTNRLSYGHTYYVTCDSGLFLDTNGASFPGIAGTNTWSFSTKASGPATPTASTGPTTITIGLDGAGDFASFQGAFDWIPQNNTLPRTIHVKPGIYRDSASLAQSRNFVTIMGDGASRTNVQLVYPFAYFAPPNTVFTAGSLRIESSDVTVLNLTLDNIIYNVYHPTGNSSSGAAGAFAGAINTLATTGNRIIFNNVIIKGGQDTVYNIQGIVYYNNCEVWGSVDYIYGAALSVFDRCNIVEIRSSGGPCTAPNTAYAQPYGLTFLNCTFPRALMANGYPYDVGAATTTFQRAWGQDGMTAIINCAVDSQISTAGWGTFGNGNENTGRARESGTTLIGGGSAPTIAQRQAAGTYWLNTIDPDYTNNPALSPTDALLAPPTGTNNRVAVTVNTNDYTLAAIFGNAYFNLSGWLPMVMPSITIQPTNQTVNPGATVNLIVSAASVPAPAYQWRKNGANISGATNSTYTIGSAQGADIGNYTVVVTNSSGSVTSSVAALTIVASIPQLPTIPGSTTNITSFGAVGDGVATNTLAIQSAINALSLSATHGGTVEIPAGVYLSGPLNLSNSINLQIDSGATLKMLPYGSYPGGASPTDFISASKLHDIAITGSGTIDGQGAAWWAAYESNAVVRPKSMFAPSTCTNVLVQGVTLQNPPNTHISLRFVCRNVTIQGIAINTTSDVISDNTDGIDVNATNCLIQNCSISDGDDHIAMTGGTGVGGITILNNTFGNGHGISIGSFTSGGLQNLLVDSSTMTIADSASLSSGIRMKSARDRGGFVSNLTYLNLALTNVQNPVFISSYYPSVPSDPTTDTGSNVVSTTPTWRDITISNVNAIATSGRNAGQVYGLPEMLITNLTLAKVTLTGDLSFALWHVNNARFVDSQINVPAGVNTFNLYNADFTVTNSIFNTNLVKIGGWSSSLITNQLAFFNARAAFTDTNVLPATAAITLGGSTLTVSNDWNMNPSLVLNFTLGTSNATIAAVSNLTLSGTINISAGSGFANGTYKLFTYGKALTWATPLLGSTPSGHGYALDTNTAGQVNLIVTPPAPAAPANLTAQGTNLLIALKWFSAASATGYNLKRSTTNGGAYFILTSLTGTNYSDMAVNPGVTYFYVVTATNSLGESVNSIQASAVPLPSMVSTNMNLRITGGQLQLTWPQDHLGWRLESQTNSLSAGLGTNWTTVSGSSATNQMSFPFDLSNGSVFFRLAY